MSYRNHIITGLARLSPRCMGCGKHNDGDVVAAHANWSEMGKSAGSKAHDFAVAFLGTLCCHAALDQGRKMSREDRKAFWMRAFWSTQEWLWTSGHLVACVVPQPQPEPPLRPKAKIAKSRRSIPSQPLKGGGFQQTHTRGLDGVVRPRKPRRQRQENDL